MKMKTDEIVKALRNHANMDRVTVRAGMACHAAADLIEKLNDFQNSQCYKLLARIAELEKQLSDARNELCQKCGRYHEAHKGACGGCKWKENLNA